MANNTNWLSVSPMSGNSGTTSLSLTALTNDTLSARTAVITGHNDTYGVSATTTVTLKAFEPTLTLSRSTLRFDRTGGTITFTVYSNTAWTISFPSLVYSYSTSAGTGDTEVTVVLSANTDTVSKVDTGTVQDTFGVNQLFLTIVQEAFINELTVTPDDDIAFDNTGSTTSVTIESNCDWEISLPSWVSASTTTGASGTTVVTFTAGENGPTDRSGNIIIYYGNKEIVIGAYQPFYIAPYITVTPSSHTFPYSASSQVFVVDSYPEWSASVISSAETDQFGGIYMEAIFNIPSAMTIQLYNGNSGNTTAIYLNAIRQYGSAYTFSTSGTHKVIYMISSGGVSPVLQGNTYLKELYFSDGVGSIQSSAFTGCSSLSSVTIGEGMTNIGAAAFSGCSSLNNITIAAETAPSICADTFYGVATGGTLNYPYGSDYNSWLKPLKYYLGYYEWPGFDGTNYILAEYNVTSTTGNGTRVLGNYYDYNVTAITLEDGTPISMYNGVYGLLKFPKIGKQKLKFYMATDKLNDSEYNYQAAFEGCTDLTSVVLADTINYIGSYTFSGCTSLTSVTFSEKTKTELQSGAFFACSGLTDFTIPETIYALPDSCFRYCQALEHIAIGKNVAEIGTGCFDNCPSLSSITCTRTIAPSIDRKTFYTNLGGDGVANNGILCYPAGSDYSAWLSNSNFYLGYFGWTGQEI